MILTWKIFLRHCNMMLYLLVIVLYTLCLLILMSYRLNNINNKRLEATSIVILTWRIFLSLFIIVVSAMLIAMKLRLLYLSSVEDKLIIIKLVKVSMGHVEL